ncbi:PKD domain-containing protein [Streptomyces resistomycificus]|uniref:PKD domain-containing protein n=1 Tax=Streptomyces resistomycificus TaxID=67356 RepID=UPI000B33DCC1
MPTLTSIDPVTVVHAGSDADGTEGDAIRISGTLSGAGSPKWTIEKGAPCAFADAGAAATTLTCRDDGTYEVTLTGGRSSDTATVTVGNAAPAITSAHGPASPVAANRATAVSAAFGDPGSADTHTCTVDWKDGGEPTRGTVSDSRCTATHTYTTAGIRRPVVTVTDDDGASDRRTLPELVVYDRAAGPAAGVGIVTSAAGAYPAQPGLTGKAAFSFTADYRRNADVPTGKVTFDFGAARLKFRSTGSDWLVVTKSRAVYQGSGTVNGAAGYGFRITATDGPDTFRIEVWKKSTGAVVYDNATAATVTGFVTVGGPRL